jgi:putative DNA primase/helicase
MITGPDIGDVAQLPYRLPDLHKAIMHGATVFIPEGEAEADHLWAWNIPATHIAKGAKEYAELFRDADVVLMPDNDNDGYAHIGMVGAALYGVARRIRVLRLADLPDEGDVIDWIAAGGTAERLLELAEEAPDWIPSPADVNPDSKRAAAHAGEQKLIDELAKLSALEYDKKRKQTARDLGVRNSSLDKEVARRRAELADEAEPTPLYPHWVVEPWPEAVDGDALIRDIMRRVLRHVILTQDQALTVALWIIMAWAHEGAAIYSPILMATSAEANSGKTTLLNVIGFLAPRSLCTVGATEAVLFRSIERWGPTIIVDEADTLLVHNEPLRAVINSGWTSGSGVLRCAGSDKTPHLFPTFCPKVIGMKGRKLPDTTMSRCIIIEMKRKKPSDRVDHFHHLDDPELANLRRRAQRWTMDNIATLKTAEPELPTGFDNRLGDNWRLMLAIADLAGGEWPDQARQAATAVAKITDALSVGVKLLADIRDIFASKAVHRIPSAELVEALVEIEGPPWANLKAGKPITKNGLALLLAPFGIASGNIRVGGDRVAKGYQVAQFQDAFERYL